MWLLVIGCEAPKDPPTDGNPVDDEQDPTPPETPPPPITTDCVSATIQGAGGTLDLEGIRVVFPPDAFGPLIASEASICLTDASVGVTPLSATWRVSSQLPLVRPASLEVELAGPPEQARLFVPDAGGIPSWAFDQDVAADPLVASLYRGGVVYAALDARLLVAYEASGMADVLFVIDNSCSMADDQNQLAATFPQVLDALDDVDIADFHIGAVSTDLDDPSHSGKLQESGGALWIEPTTVDPERVFSNLVQMGTNGSGVEKGIGATHAAIALEGPAYNAGFFRADATLAIAVVSDEPDATPGSFISQTDLENYLLDLDQEVRFHSLVDLQLGADYTATSQGVGGSVADIYSNNWTSWMEDVLDGMQIWMALEPEAADEPEVWWLTDGLEPQRVPEGQVRADGVTVVLDSDGFGPDGAAWLLYTPVVE